MGIIENIINQVLEKSGHNEKMRQIRAERDLLWIVFSQTKEAEKEFNKNNKKLNESISTN